MRYSNHTRSSKNQLIRVAFASSIFSLLLLASGCSLLKARPLESAGFLPQPELLAERSERAPFNGYWNLDPERYDGLLTASGKLFIAPIDISLVRKMYQDASGSESTKQDRIEEAEELAKYFREVLKRSLQRQMRRKLTLVKQPDSETVQLRLGLVQVVPTSPGINLVGTVAGFFIPGGGLIKYAGEGSIAMEGFAVVGDPDEVLFEEFKDREGQKASAFTVKDYQRYAHIRVVIDDWAEQIAELLTTPPSHTVEDSIPVSLNPF